jgi:zinc transporter ZupT
VYCFNKPEFSKPKARGSDGMRLKLVLIASFVSAIAGAGASIAIILGKFSSLKGLSAPDLLVASTFILPVAAVVGAAIFVYRHTARRRKTQALLTGFLSAFLSLAIFILASVLTSRATPTQPPPLAPRNVG